MPQRTGIPDPTDDPFWRWIPEAVLERDYCLAWFLVGLSRAPLIVSA